MRWKLILIAAMITAIVGAGLPFMVYRLLGFTQNIKPSILLIGLLVPLLTIFASSLFVYRHTARRRSLQAMATALLSCILMLLTLIFAITLTTGQHPKRRLIDPINIGLIFKATH
jgi:hypothetical protein